MSKHNKNRPSDRAPEQRGQKPANREEELNRLIQLGRGSDKERKGWGKELKRLQEARSSVRERASEVVPEAVKPEAAPEPIVKKVSAAVNQVQQGPARGAEPKQGIAEAVQPKEQPPVQPKSAPQAAPVAQPKATEPPKPVSPTPASAPKAQPQPVAPQPQAAPVVPPVQPSRPAAQPAQAKGPAAGANPKGGVAPQVRSGSREGR